MQGERHMAQWHGISKKKPSGGRRVQARGKRSTEISTEKQFALVGEARRKIYRKAGGNTMVRVMAANKVSVNNPKTGKTVNADIINVIQNESDPRAPSDQQVYLGVQTHRKVDLLGTTRRHPY
ncbi:MAG: hypothetical protein ACPG8X_07605, partial [Candidatus Poseidoniaceae archaeon]